MERNLICAGFGGQGVMMIGTLLAFGTCNSTDKHVTYFPSYGAEMRGGTANCYVSISDEEIGAPVVDMADDLIIMNQPSLVRFLPKLKPGGNLFLNTSLVDPDVSRPDIRVIEAPVTEMAMDMGNAKILNIIMLGVYVGFTDILDKKVLLDAMNVKLGKRPDLLPLNYEAYEKGYSIGAAAKKDNP